MRLTRTWVPELEIELGCNVCDQTDVIAGDHADVEVAAQLWWSTHVQPTVIRVTTPEAGTWRRRA
jgi:hypothetical protein